MDPARVCRLRKRTAFFAAEPLNIAAFFVSNTA